jgi:hypothetical protein
MKSTIDQITAPPFDTRDKRARIALKEWTIARLWQLDEEADAGRRYDLLLTPEGRARTQYVVAKSSARCGNLEALRAFLISITGDPEIAEFIAEPRRPRGRRRPQKTVEPSILRASKYSAVVTVKRVRQIWQRQYRKWKRSDRLAEEIAAEYCGLSEDEVEEALKRQTCTRRPAR